jgi:hypothetical protein
MNSAAARLARIHALQEELTSSPWSHDVLELAMATIVSVELSRGDDTALVWLIVAGSPSSDKTATVLLLKGGAGIEYVDSLTENALASGYVPQRGHPRKPDLLTQMQQHKSSALLIKDLTTLFSQREDKVKKILGDLQSIYDGEFAKATGTAGMLTYTHRFSVVACVTPMALAKHHKYMGDIGGRFLIYRVPPLTDAERSEGFVVLRGGKGRKQESTELRQLVAQHLEEAQEAASRFEGETGVQWARINLLAELLAHGRASIRWHQNSYREWEIELVQIEEPFRGAQQLRNLGRGLAAVHGRTRMTEHELELLRRVVLASMPVDRADVLGQFRPEGFTAKECARLIGKSDDRARQLLDELVRVGLAVAEEGPSQVGRPATIYRPHPKFAELVTRPVEALDHFEGLAVEDFSAKSPHKDTQLTEIEDLPSGEFHRKSTSLDSFDDLILGDTGGLALIGSAHQDRVKSRSRALEASENGQSR